MPKTKITTRKEKNTKKGKEIKKEKKAPKKKIYFGATGRRKTAVARVRLFTQGENIILINDKPIDIYFPNLEFRETIKAPLAQTKSLDKFRITSVVKGGGLSAQAEALRHGIARALVLFNSDFRKKLKKAGFLKRDPRMRERKKFGLKRARRAPQWAKR